MVAYELEVRSRERLVIGEAAILYQEYAQELALDLGEKAVEKMITVVRLDTTIPDITRGIPLEKDTPLDAVTSKPYAFFEGELKIPDFFVPSELRDPGHGDHVFFLGKNQAAPVIDERNRSRLIANQNGRAKNVANSLWNRQRLGSKTAPALPRDAHPRTEEMIRVLLPNT